MEQKGPNLKVIEPAAVIRLEDANQQLRGQLAEKEQQLLSMQQQLAEAKQRNEVTEKNLYEMITTNDQIKAIYEAKQAELEHLKTQQLDNKPVTVADTRLEEQLTEQNRLNQEITQVLVQVRRDAKEIEDKANIEAQAIVSNAKQKSREILVEAAKELEEIKKNLQIYQTQLTTVKQESNQLFDHLNEKVEKLINTTIHE